MKLDNINIIIALLILISLSIICHIKEWIPNINTNYKKYNNFSNISKYAKLMCPNDNCSKDECTIIHAQIPEELTRNCNKSTNQFNLNNDDIKKYFKQLYITEVIYALNKVY